MNPWLLTALILSAVFVFGWTIYTLVIRAVRQTAAIPSFPGTIKIPKPCYRCRGDAITTYMGLDYCFMCREVVVMMSSAVGNDPPYGFPGSPGYLEVPKEIVEEEKEA